MLDNLTQRLAKVVKTLRGQARLTEDNIADMLREVRMALLEADVALPVVKEFIARVKEKAVGQEVIGSLTPGQALVGVVHRELTDLMGGAKAALNLATQPPAVILMAGLAGRRQDHHYRQAGQVAQGAPEEEGAGGQLRRVSAGGYRAAEDGLGAGRYRFLPVGGGPEARSISPRRRSTTPSKHYYDVLFVDTAGSSGHRRGHDGRRCATCMPR